MEQIFIRGYYFTLIATVGMYATKSSILNLEENERKVCYYRSFFVNVCHMFMFYFLEYLSVTIFTLLFLTFTIFTPIWERLILKRPFSRVYFIFLFLSFLGVFFLLQPSFLFGGESSEDTQEPMFYVSVVGTLIAANFRSVRMVVCKTINSSVNPFTMNLFLGPPSTLAAGIIWYLVLRRTSEFEVIGLLLIGLAHSLIFCATTLVYLAVRFEQPSVVALICYSQILFTYIAELIFYSIDLDIYALVGAIILASSTFGLLVYNYLSKLRAA